MNDQYTSIVRPSSPLTEHQRAGNNTIPDKAELWRQILKLRNDRGNVVEFWERFSRCNLALFHDAADAVPQP